MRDRAAPLWLDAAGDQPTVRSLLALIPHAVTGILTLAFVIGFSWLAVLRHQAFQSHAFDLGNVDQAVWNTLHGNLLRFTDMTVGGHVLTSRLAIHVEPILIAISPLYLLHNGPETLLVLQATIVGLGAVPAYLLARDALHSSWLALPFPIAFLLHPSIQNAVLDDFHAVALSACFLLWAFYFVTRGNVPAFAIFAVLAASTKEEVGLVVAAMGILLLIKRRTYSGLMTIILGAGWFFVSVESIIPAFNTGNASPYLARYAYLGHGLSGVIGGIARHPHVVLDTLGSNSRLEFLSFILHPLGFTSVLQAPVFLLTLPALLIDMLSSDPSMYSGLYQYPAEIIPFAIAASVLGIAMLVGRAEFFEVPGSRYLAVVLCSLVLIASLVDTWRYGFSPLARGYLIPSPGTHQQVENTILNLIPPNATVAAADEIEPHLADRHWIYLLPTVHPKNGPPADYIVLDASTPSRPIEPHTLHAAVLKAFAHGYGVLIGEDGVLLLIREASSPYPPPNRSGAAMLHLVSRSLDTFIYEQPSGAAVISASWASLELNDVVVHPRDGFVNRSRPAVEVETYWQTNKTLPHQARIVFYLSPVYTGAHPAFSSQWQVDADNPTTDWLPMHAWLPYRSVRVASLDMVPDVYETGKVDIAVAVSGLGPARSGNRVQGNSRLVRLGTIEVSP